MTREDSSPSSTSAAVDLSQRLAAMQHEMARLRQTYRSLWVEFQRSQDLANRCLETFREAESVTQAFPFRS